MIYRVLIPIATTPPIEAGYIGPLPFSEDKIRRFLEREIISEVNIPPLGIFPQWKERERRMKEVEISPEQLLVLPREELMKRLDLSESELSEWQRDLRRILII